MTDTQFRLPDLCYAVRRTGPADDTGTQIVKVRGDKAHPVSKGYTCNKAARISFYQNGKDRLTTPLRRRADGSFEASIGTRQSARFCGVLKHQK